MRNRKRKTILCAINLLAAVLWSVFLAAPAFAHGDEDHGEAETKTVSSAKGTVTRTARAGEFEIMLKHAPLEPDAATSAKLFITRYGTNEPFGGASPTVEITAPDGKTFEASEVKADAPGSYSLKLPLLAEGNYTILARFSAAGKSDTATFSAVAVEHSHTETLAEAGSWAQSALMVLAALIVLGLFGGLIYFALRIVKSEPVGEEAVSA
ncbi:MAG: copper resistance protein CopC [Pyrinomonadaceae bacterium]|nr:copper resistance protein CopC [Pyrinomonadaceae bacterium]